MQNFAGDQHVIIDRANLGYFMQGRRGGQREQIAPGPQAAKGFMTQNASRTGGPHKVNSSIFLN